MIFVFCSLWLNKYGLPLSENSIKHVKETDMNQERNNSTTKERMQEVLTHYGLTAYEFEERCGLNHSWVKRLNREIPKKTRTKIKDAFPDLNIEYIALGVGEIIETPGVTRETIKERIMQFIESKNIKQIEFNQKTQLSYAYIRNMTGNPRHDSLEKIYRAYPSLSKEWIEKGIGEMILDVPREIKTDSPSERIVRLAEFLGLSIKAFKNRAGITSNLSNVTLGTVEKIAERYPFVNPQWVSNGEGEMFYSKPLDGLAYAPFVSETEYVNYLNKFSDETYISSLRRVPYIKDSELKDDVMAFEVSGEKMNDGTLCSYVPGDVVLCREISTTRLYRSPEIINQYDFVIINSNGIHIRKIVNYDENKVIITIKTLNSFYPEEEINLSEVKKLFVIIERTRRINNKQ